MIGPYSPKLTALEKASLKTIQEGDFENGLQKFLAACFPLVRQTLQPHFEKIDLAAVELLKKEQLAAPYLRGLERVFWKGEELTAWAENFLLWIEKPEQVFEPNLSIEELNDYLLRSLDFYESLELALDLDGTRVFHSEDSEGESHTVDIPVLNSEAIIDATFHEPLPESVRSEESGMVTEGAFAEVVDDLVEEQTTDSQEVEEGEELAFTESPLTPFEDNNRLVVRNKYLGYGKNSEGVVGLCGQLTISYFRDRELVGHLESSNPLLFISPNRLSGLSTKVTYWLPPVAFPHPAGQLTVRTSDESKTLALHTLFPKSRTDFMGDGKVTFYLLLPALVGFLYFSFVYFLTATGIDREARLLFPDTYIAAWHGTDTIGFRSGGLGLYQLRIVPAAESLQMIWAAIILLSPLVSSKFFYFLSRARRRQFAGLLAAALLLPTVCLLVSWNFQGEVFPLYQHNDFRPLDLRGFLAWSVPMNLLVAGYLFFSVFGVWDRIIKSREARFFLPFLLTLGYLVVMFFVIYGRSWAS